MASDTIFLSPTTLNVHIQLSLDKKVSSLLELKQIKCTITGLPDSYYLDCLMIISTKRV